MPSPIDVGVDVSKEVLQAIEAVSGRSVRVANRRSAMVRWLKQLPAGSRIAMEATGGYHQLLADLAHAQGMKVYVLNACDVWHYARGVGVRGKTDRVDARVIVRYLVSEGPHLHCYTPPTPTQREIDQLVRRRKTVVTTKTRLRLSLRGMRACEKQLRIVIKHLDALLATFDRRLKELAKPQAESQAHLQTVPGIGPLVGVALVNTFERVPLHSGDAAVAFLGMDPRPKDSGQSTGRRRLSKRGPSELRRLMFCAARAASHSKVWRPVYQAYRARGLSTTEATVVLARKLRRVAFALYRQGTRFDAARLKPA
jgi:transposase